MANPILDPNAPAFTRRYMNLADPRLGAKALYASDEFFALKASWNHAGTSPQRCLRINGRLSPRDT